jgi:hypothetical protein
MAKFWVQNIFVEMQNRQIVVAWYDVVELYEFRI